MTDFRVETIHLDLPPLVEALGRRLHDAGVPGHAGRARPSSPARSTLVRPVSRRSLYWTARGVLVSDQAQVPAFDRVFFSVFGDRPEDDVELEEVRTAPGTARRAAASRHGWNARRHPRQACRPRPPAAARTTAEAEVPLALASDEELLRRKRFDALEPHELAQLYRLMSRLELAPPKRRTRRYEKGRRGGADRLEAHAAQQPAHRR